MNELVVIPPLPQLPVQMHPLVGTGLVKSELEPIYPHCHTAEQAMAYWRSLHSAERAPYRCLFWMQPQGKTGETAIVRFLLDFNGKHQRLVGKTLNDPDAAKILIANWRAGRLCTSVRWELYADRECEDLLDMGRFDQWDLLSGISEEKLQTLAARGVAPAGDWDFDKMLWGKKCSICGKQVSVNFHLYSIDSVVCAECHNRPFLADDLHHYLDEADRSGDREFSDYAAMHSLHWLASAGAGFDQVRKDLEDVRGARLRRLWNQSTMMKALQPGSENQVRALLESKTSLSFELYQACCAKMEKALSGEEPFSEEHRIAIDFVLRTTELLRVRQLATARTLEK